MNEIELCDQKIDLDDLKSVYLNMDCMEGMKKFPDNYFDLAVVDPPYGDAGQTFKRTDKSRFGGHFDNYKPTDGGGIEDMESVWRPIRQVQTTTRTGGTWAAKFGKKIISWDHAPSDEYFEELFRVSKDQIIWGGNYYGLPPNRCFLIWKKTNIPESFSMSMAEYAWCSFNNNAKVFDYSSAGQPDRFHPSQKPIELYSWIYKLYTKPGMKILDTHVGSASSLIAAHDFGLTYVGFEIDEDYYEKSKKRLTEYESQTTIFDFGVERT